MIGCAAMKKESILQPQFVSADYFLCKIREFEVKHDQSWSQFFSEFSSGKKDRDNADYVEWAFLCRTFLPELIEMENVKSPPNEAIEIAQEPEGTRAFALELNIVRPGRLLQAHR
jgi:hypothetical protein